MHANQWNAVRRTKTFDAGAEEKRDGASVGNTDFTAGEKPLLS